MNEGESISLVQRRAFPLDSHKPRPGGQQPDGIILHSMGQKIGGTFAGDFLQEIGLSAHYLINPDGLVYECVDPKREAYHAGKSKFKGRKNLNGSFVGIELLIAGDHTYATFLDAIKKEEVFTEYHYQSCFKICSELMREFHISPSRIVRHSDVSGPDVRSDPKKDPGPGFDFDRVKEQLQALEY